MSVGLEDVDDLTQDLDQALQVYTQAHCNKTSPINCLSLAGFAVKMLKPEMLNLFKLQKFIR